MEVVGSCLVVTLDLRPGVRVAVAWDGGRYVNVHAVSNGGFGVLIESFDVWDQWLDRPRLDLSLAALERFALGRLGEADVDGWIADLAESVSDFEEEHRGELAPASLN
jgi:hypothetical protein